MAFFAVYDEWPTHPKVIGATRQARALWSHTGPLCSKDRADGYVSPVTLRTAAKLCEYPAKNAAGLVEVGLWHDHQSIHDCPRCFDGEDGAKPWRGAGVLDVGWFFFHDWWHYQLGSAGKHNSIEQARELRKRRLSYDRRLCAAIRGRDRDLCRYCGEPTIWSVGRGGDTRSPLAGTFDHLNPFDFGDGSPASDGGNSLDKIVVACRTCNGRKRDRTPVDAGMVLLPEPTRSLGLASQATPWTDPGPTPNQSVDQSGEGRGSVVPALAHEAGPGLVVDRSRIGLGSGIGLVGLVNPSARAALVRGATA